MSGSEPDSANDSATQAWAVWRMDDTGNQFVVRERLSRVEAERLAHEFAARGHKQMYWAARQSTE